MGSLDTGKGMRVQRASFLRMFYRSAGACLQPCALTEKKLGKNGVLGPALARGYLDDDIAAVPHDSLIILT
jgi:hypothetical protein